MTSDVQEVRSTLISDSSMCTHLFRKLLSFVLGTVIRKGHGSNYHKSAGRASQWPNPFSVATWRYLKLIWDDPFTVLGRPLVPSPEQRTRELCRCANSEEKKSTYDTNTEMYESIHRDGHELCHQTYFLASSNSTCTNGGASSTDFDFYFWIGKA